MPPRRRNARRSRSQGPLADAGELHAEPLPPAAARRSTQLIPYSPWRIILYKRNTGQMVLYNPESRTVVAQQASSQALPLLGLQSPIPENAMAVAHRSRTVSLEARPYVCTVCPTCRQLMPARSEASWAERPAVEGGAEHEVESSVDTVVDREYFRLLAQSIRLPKPALALAGSGGDHQTHGTGEPALQQMQLVPSLDGGSSSGGGGGGDDDDESRAGRKDSGHENAGDGVSQGSFNQGYYERFFVEQRKLGKGLRGSVFSCQHVLDGIHLGHYAVKKVAVGNNRQWLRRMLREVKLLESLRHPNVVEYKHSWLEVHQPTPFGPKVPCLFILMEYANGGNLLEYMEPETSGLADKRTDSSLSLKSQILKRRRQSCAAAAAAEAPAQGGGWTNQPGGSGRRRTLAVEQIWSFFADICSGLAHLHQLQIIHRDLKHMNLLLQWRDPGRRDADGEMPRIMLTDFGECEVLSQLEKRERTGATGTLEFMAPELLAVDEDGRYLDSYSTKSDMWSLGMVLYYLCYTGMPFTDIDDIDVLRRDVLGLRHVDLARTRRPEGADEVPQELRRIMQLLLNHDEAKRPDIGDVVQLVAEYSDLWHSRQFGKSRFEVHDSDVGSSHPGTPRQRSPVPGSSPVLGSSPASRARAGSRSARGSAPAGPAASATALVPSHLSRESFAEASGTSDLSESADDAVPGTYALAHLPAIATPMGAADVGTGTGGEKAAPVRGAKRGHAAADGAEPPGAASIKRRRLSERLGIGPAFCVKTAVLLAKAYALQCAGPPRARDPGHVAYIMCFSLVLSALDIHHRSLRLTAALLAVNACVVWWWLCCVG
ncbi:putative serine/threonine-protein kinase iks1 [Coemansia javaensis]|uniref:non-specific serine/threonine protein kinase n=1 Tax=Coemansia javaensis TaxID=2761396 RepID=A0A9W8HH41_9FUNG|nr:putative serine/threonine-protein kinase iks1 [Coemansia javaensis]